MSWIITRLCRDCIDTVCAKACPVDCIYEYTGTDRTAFPNQLYINPRECVDCGACEPRCPWQAIFEEGSVPRELADDIALNYSMIDRESEFRVQEYQERERPTPEQVAANKAKWGVK